MSFLFQMSMECQSQEEGEWRSECHSVANWCPCNEKPFFYCHCGNLWRKCHRKWQEMSHRIDTYGRFHKRVTPI